MYGWAPPGIPVEVRPQHPGTGANTVATGSYSADPDDLSNTAMDTSHANKQQHPDILRLIFGYLDIPDRGRVAQVCRDWKDVAYERSIWRGIEVKLRLPDLRPSLYGSLSRRGITRVKVISLNGGLRELLQNLHGLTSLDFSECHISDSCIVESFSEQLPSLVCLNLSWSPELTDVSMACLSKFLPNLKQLYLRGCKNITDAGMSCIAAKCHSLKCLKLEECEISDVALKRLAGISGTNTTSDTSERLGVRSLKHLALQSCNRISENGLKYLSFRLTSLVSLDLSTCPKVNDECLKRIARIRSLKKLVLAECENFTCQGIFYLARARCRLNCLILSECHQIDDGAIRMITRGKGLRNLTELSLDSCPITNAGLSVVAEKLRDLTTLDISECDFISEDGISSVAAHLRKLRSIDMGLCAGVTNASLEHLARMASLEVINLSACEKIARKGMKLIASGEGQSSVLELDLSYTTIGDADLRYIAKGMQKLKSLDLCGCMISDKGLAHIAQRLHNLETLKISFCSLITDRGVKEVALHMNLLREIDIEGCSRVTSSATWFFVVMRPHVKFI